MGDRRRAVSPKSAVHGVLAPSPMSGWSHPGIIPGLGSFCGGVPPYSGGLWRLPTMLGRASPQSATRDPVRETRWAGPAPGPGRVPRPGPVFSRTVRGDTHQDSGAKDGGRRPNGNIIGIMLPF